MSSILFLSLGCGGQQPAVDTTPTTEENFEQRSKEMNDMAEKMKRMAKESGAAPAPPTSQGGAISTPQPSGK